MILSSIIFLLLALMPQIILFLSNKKEGSYLHDKIIYGFFGVYFGSTFLAFRYLGNKYHQFSFFHIYIYAFAFIFPCVLFYMTKQSQKAQGIVRIVLSAILFCVVISRFFTWTLIRKSAFVATLPFHPCNLMSALMLPAVLFNKQGLKNVVCSLGFIGGVAALFFAFNEGLGTIWHILNLDSYIMHLLLTAIPIYIVLTGAVAFNRNYFFKSLVFFLPFYVFLVFFNQRYNTTFFFTRKPNGIGKIIYNALPLIKVNDLVFNPIYYVVCLGGAILACVIIIEFFSLLMRTVLKNIITPNCAHKACVIMPDTQENIDALNSLTGMADNL